MLKCCVAKEEGFVSNRNKERTGMLRQMLVIPIKDPRVLPIRLWWLDAIGPLSFPSGALFSLQAQQITSRIWLPLQL